MIHLCMFYLFFNVLTGLPYIGFFFDNPLHFDVLHNTKKMSLLLLHRHFNLHVCSVNNEYLSPLFVLTELNKNRRKLFEPPNIRSSFLEGGASGRLPRQFHTDIASVSGRWWAHANASTHSLNCTNSHSQPEIKYWTKTRIFWNCAK